MLKVLTRFYDRFFSLFSCLGTPLIFLMRIYWGYLFFNAGWGKLNGIDGVAQYFDSLGSMLPLATAWAVAVIETAGGIGLILGLFSRLWGLSLSVVMIGAYMTAHFPAVQGLINDPALFVAEPPFHYLLTSLLVLIYGPGAWAVDKWMRKKI
jgi:putative oxidoreductase